ncbi:hypothetical protein HK097_010162 [Rhizophlyctis rosea]|uniref:Beta-xylanase n=1 Tax=Rhizophlyctis rosea TaxID=64517 RepID=A0AAD5X540_9FUNG|nr:hypothetical protein HK097_010162 [Rhizophlyctis rosea]
MRVLSASAAFLLLQGAAAQTLKGAANANGRYMGTITDPAYINGSDRTYNTIALQEFDYITAENSMKWDAIEPSNNGFSFNNADTVVNWAQQNGFKVRGHTLVWHSQLPSWVANGSWSKSSLTAVIQNHVAKVMGRYKGKIAQWDVVNEIFDENGGARDSVFSRVFGGLDEFVTVAFNAARAADPDAILCINDYNLDYNGGKANGMISLVRRLKANGVPIDCIGSQAHLVVGSVSSSFGSTLSSLCSTAGKCALTELDIRARTPISSSAAQQQKTDYTTAVRACAVLNNCLGVTVWGITDSRSWIPGVFSGEGDALPWNSSYQKKPAYDGILAGWPAGSTTTTTRTTTTTTTTRPTTTTTNGSTCGSDGTVTVTVPGGTTTVQGPAVTVTVGGQTTTTTQSNGGQGSALYGQCGGQGWTGPTTCAQGTCRVSNQWYSQCLP